MTVTNTTKGTTGRRASRREAAWSKDRLSRAGQSRQGQLSPQGHGLRSLHGLWVVRTGCSLSARSSPGSVTGSWLRALNSELVGKVGRWVVEAGPRGPLPGVADTSFIP